MVLEQANQVVRDAEAGQASSWETLVSEAREAWTSATTALDNARWLTGDAVLLVETRWGNQALQKFAAEVGLKYGAVREYRRIADRFPFATRVANVSWSVHRRLACVRDEEVKLELLRQAAKEGWTDRKARDRIADLGGLLDDNPATRGRSRKALFDEDQGPDLVDEEGPSDAQRWKRFIRAFEDARDLPWPRIAESPRFSHLVRSHQVVSNLREIGDWAHATLDLLLADPDRLGGDEGISRQSPALALEDRVVKRDSVKCGTRLFNEGRIKTLTGRDAARLKLDLRLLAEIDASEPGLSASERNRRLLYAREARFAKMALASAKAKRNKKAAHREKRAANEEGEPSRHGSAEEE